MAWCDSEGVAYEIIPGVSSLFAAAAALKQELTLPGISQTVIITRLSGRTKVPAGEALKNLAMIKATLVIFLSVDKIGKAVKNLISGYDKNTPAAVVYRASWDDEKVITGTLGDIAAKVKREGVKRQALIFVGNVLGKKGFTASELYNKKFFHSYRRRDEVSDNNNK
jgi:precorrin-4/cobalt-precorrin-4 C11-methyltransferase